MSPASASPMSNNSGDPGSLPYSQPRQQQPHSPPRHTELASGEDEQHVQQQPAQPPALQQQPPPTKRRRIGYACNLCRVKKNRCDGERPTCGSCRERRQECVYSPQRAKISISQEYVDSLRERNRVLEEHLAGQRIQISQSPYDNSYSKESPLVVDRRDQDRNRAAALQHQQERNSTSPLSSTTSGTRQEPRYQHRGRALSTSSKRLSRSYQADNSSGTDEPRSGRPSMSGYFGESSTFDFITKVTSPNTTDPTVDSSGVAVATPATGAAVGGHTPGTPSSTRRSAAEISTRKDATEASEVRGILNPESLAESSSSTVVFEELLGIGGEMGASNGSSDLFELPQRSVADRLVASYFSHRHPLNPYLHEGTFRRRYERLWLSQDVGGEEAVPSNLAWLGLVNMVFAFGSEHVQARAPRNDSPASSSSKTGSKLDRTRFFKRAKMLEFSSILQAKIELVQALLLMSHYLHGSLELNHCWTVVGLAIRTAQELGLHLDPANFTNDILEQEIRKRVWWGCFVIDRNLSIKVGRPPTIHEMPGIKVGLPLPVDDEFLQEESSYAQPSHIPSKLEFFRQIIGQCRLVEKVLDTLYDNTPIGSRGSSNSSPDSRETRLRLKTDLPDLLARSIQLDGALMTWQEMLPAHLRPESDVPEWHFERQRSVLLMRFLHTRLLIHRQTLLYYISRRISDPFQLELVYPCIKRCVTAAYDSITQVRLLRQYNLLSSSWHNSHYVFAALGVLLVYQNLDQRSRSGVGIPASLDIDEVISQGLANLQRVGGEIHPLASRYVISFQQLQTRLQSIASLSANAPSLTVRGKQQQQGPLATEGDASNYPPIHGSSTAASDHGSSAEQRHFISTNNGSADKESMPIQEQEQDGNGINFYSEYGYREIDSGSGRSAEYADERFLLAGFDEEFAILQSALLDSNELGQGFLGNWEHG